jgi:hypothetical protein
MPKPQFLNRVRRRLIFWTSLHMPSHYTVSSYPGSNVAQVKLCPGLHISVIPISACHDYKDTCLQTSHDWSLLSPFHPLTSFGAKHALQMVQAISLASFKHYWNITVYTFSTPRPAEYSPTLGPASTPDKLTQSDMWVLGVDISPRRWGVKVTEAARSRSSEDCRRPLINFNRNATYQGKQASVKTGLTRI